MKKRKNIHFVKNFTVTCFYYIPKCIGSGKELSKSYEELFKLCLAEVSFLDWGISNRVLKTLLFPFAYLRSILLLMYDMQINNYSANSLDSCFLDIVQQLNSYSLKYSKGQINLAIEDTDSKVFQHIQIKVYGIIRELYKYMEELR